MVTRIRGSRRAIPDAEWMTFPGGELEGARPLGSCQACRARGTPPKRRAPLCFQCYRTGLARERALEAAGRLDTASEERFQTALPFEPVRRERLDRLRAERAIERDARQRGAGRHVDKRRHAQIAARLALEGIAAGIDDRRARILAMHAAELRLPEAWLPFVMSR